MAMGKMSRRRGKKPVKVQIVNKKYKKYRYSINRPLLGNTFTTTLRYYSQAILNPGAGGTLATWVLRASDLYDPDVTNVGHQPRGFDQLMPLYDHFVVLGSKITLKYAHPNEGPMTVTLALKDSSTVETSTEDYVEGRNCVYSLCPSHERATLTLGYSPKTFFSVKNPTDEKDLQGTRSSTPHENAFYHISCASPDGNDPQPASVCLVVEYIAQFIEPKQPSSS